MTSTSILTQQFCSAFSPCTAKNALQQKNISTALQKAARGDLRQEITVTINGQRQTITRKDLITHLTSVAANDKKDSFSVSDEERQGPREHVKPQTFDLNVENIEEDNVDKLGIARPRLNLNHLQVKGPRTLALTQ